MYATSNKEVELGDAMGSKYAIFQTLAGREKQIADWMSDEDPDPEGKTKEELDNYLSPLHPEFIPDSTVEENDYAKLCKNTEKMAEIYLNIAMKDYLSAIKYDEETALKTAKTCYNDAMSYFLENKDIFGQAHVLLGMGEIAIFEKNWQSMQIYLKNAIIFYDNAGKDDFSAYAKSLLEQYGDEYDKKTDPSSCSSSLSG